MAHHPTPLKFLFPGWYAIVMGLSGLSLAWHRASPLMGDPAGMVSLAIGLLAAAVFVVLAAATVLRGMRHADVGHRQQHHVARTLAAAGGDGQLEVLRSESGGHVAADEARASDEQDAGRCHGNGSEQGRSPGSRYGEHADLRSCARGARLTPAPRARPIPRF